MSRHSFHSTLVCLAAACGPVGPASSTGPTTVDTGTDATTAGGTTTGSPTSGGTTSTSTSPATSLDPSTSSPGSGSTSDTGLFVVGADLYCLNIGPDGMLRCSRPPNDCDPWTQDCPDGQKCMPYSGDGDGSWESLKCTEVAMNPGQVGDPCTVEGGAVSGIDSCDVGLMCWNTDIEGAGTCVAMCKGAPDDPMCPEGSACSISNEGVLILCLPSCDPLLQDCPDGEVCIANPGDPDSFVCALDASAEEGQEHDPCEYANACDPGLFCADPAADSNCAPDASGCCLAFCDLTNPQCSSPAPVECVPWYTPGPAPPGYEDLGACIIPE